jgi:amino acid adenylation domain-containing protein
MSQTSDTVPTVLDIIAQHVKRSPDKLGIVSTASALTYAQLDSEIEKCADSLREYNIQRNEVVVIRSTPSAAFVCAAFGVLRAHGVLLLLDPSQPQHLQDRLISNVRARLIISAHDENCSLTISSTVQSPRIVSAASDVAYLIYTSGSTGTPKAVVCSHRGLSNVALGQLEIFQLKPEDRVAQIAPWSVDAALFEMILALGSGASLHIADQEARYSGRPLEQFLAREQASVMVATPSTLRALSPPLIPSVRLVISAGEALLPDVARPWVNRRLFNAYGVTEGTIWSTCSLITEATLMTKSASLPIGHAIPGCTVSVLDTTLRPVNVGEQGEIFIGGAGVAVGYMDVPESIGERFVTTPVGRMFRTGDIALCSEAGDISFVGREDEQVKLGGLRVELGEVRQVLTNYPAVRECAICVDGGRLVAYVVFGEGVKPESPAIIRWLEERLPRHMVPTLYIPVTHLPMTAWGKLDRSALKSPVQAIAERSRPSPSRGSSTESSLIQILREALELPAISPRDDLFMLGMTSLSMTIFISQASDKLGVAIDSVDVFEHPTVIELATLIDQRRDV